VRKYNTTKQRVLFRAAQWLQSQCATRSFHKGKLVPAGAGSAFPNTRRWAIVVDAHQQWQMKVKMRLLTSPSGSLCRRFAAFAPCYIPVPLFYQHSSVDSTLVLLRVFHPRFSMGLSLFSTLHRDSEASAGIRSKCWRWEVLGYGDFEAGPPLFYCLGRGGGTKGQIRASRRLMGGVPGDVQQRSCVRGFLGRWGEKYPRLSFKYPPHCTFSITTTGGVLGWVESDLGPYLPIILPSYWS
jgi:hypothetical protein